MLAATRNFAKSWPARILMAVLAVSFIGWGVNQSGVSVTRNDVITAGSRHVNATAFKREYDSYKKRYEEQSGQPITPEMAEQNGLDGIVLQGLAGREALAEMITRSGVKPGDALLLDQIQKIPAFFDPITGRFDKVTFQQRLAENNMTPQSFDAMIRDDLAAQHWTSAIVNGLSAPASYGALASLFSLEARDIAYINLPPGSVPQPPAPTDAQLTTFINENKEQLTRPEMRVLVLAPFSPQAIPATSIPIDPAELQKRFDFRKDTLSQPETRSLVQIPVKDQAAAQQVAARLSRGEAPAAIAKSLGVDAITFQDKPVTAIADRKAGQAAFKLTAGQIAPIQGDLGLSVVKIESVTPGRAVTLDQARPMLEAEIRKDAIAEKVYQQTQAYDDARQGGANLVDAAKKAGVPATVIGPITAQGVDGMGRQLQGFPPKVLETAFALPAGGESEVVELGDGVYFAVRVEKVLPAAVPPLAEIRPQIAAAWMQREVLKALEARAATLTARLQKGESIDAVAKSAGLQVTRVTGLSRQTAQTRADLGRDVLGRTFSASPKDVWSARGPAGLVVGRIEAVRADAGPAAALIAQQNRGQLTQVIFREMGESAQAYAKAKLKVKTDAARARAAAGFEPKEPAAAAEKKK